jgi:hypothetical protein
MKEIVEAFTQAIHMNLAYCKYHCRTTHLYSTH